MKVVAFNGSPRRSGNTRQLIDMVLDVVSAEGIETEVVQLGGNLVHGCTACMKCKENQDQRCVLTNDIINDCIEKMISADGIIIGSPTYVADITPETKALIDRTAYVVRANDNLLNRKVGAGVSAVRRAGSIHALDSINHFFHVTGMITPGSSYWNLGIGRQVGDVLNDQEGVQCMNDLGANIAWLLKKINA